MANDGVDKYNYKWMVLLLLVMSLASFIIPLHPRYQEQQQQSPISVTPTGDKSKVKKMSIKPPKVTVACWTPERFTGAHVLFTHSFCANQFNAALRGEIDANGVYQVPMEHPIPRDRNEAGRIKTLDVVLKPFFEMKSETEESIKEGERLKTSVDKLVTYQTPIMLLVSALCLLLPQMIWSFLSECCGSFNVAQTLESAVRASATDGSTRQQIYQDISAYVSSSVRSSPKTASTLYLVKKLLAALVVVALLIVVSQHAMPEVDRLGKDLDTLTPVAVKSSDTTKPVPVVHQTQGEMLQNLTKEVFYCDMGIRLLSNIQTYTFQCIVNSVDYDDETEASPPTSTSTPLVPSSDQERNLLQLSSLLYKIVLSLLVILAVVNVSSVCSWLFKLLGDSSKTCVGLTATAAMDTAFLIHMARINVGADVTYRLTQTLTGFEQIDQSEMAEKRC